MSKGTLQTMAEISKYSILKSQVFYDKDTNFNPKRRNIRSFL